MRFLMLLLSGFLIFVSPIGIQAQSACDPDLLRIVNALNAAQVSAAAGDQAAVLRYLQSARTEIDAMIAACEVPQSAEATDQPAAEATAEVTPEATRALGETVVIASDVVLSNQFTASENIFTVNIPSGFTYAEDTVTYNATAVAVAAFEPSLGSDLPGALPPFNVLYGSPLAIAYWSGLFDASALEAGFSELASFESALNSGGIADTVDRSGAQVYPIEVNGNSGVAVRLTAQVQISAAQESIEAMFYIVEYPSGLFAAFTAIALEGDLDAQLPVLNAIALSFQPGL